MKKVNARLRLYRLLLVLHLTKYHVLHLPQRVRLVLRLRLLRRLPQRVRLLLRLLLLRRPRLLHLVLRLVPKVVMDQQGKVPLSLKLTGERQKLLAPQRLLGQQLLLLFAKKQKLKGHRRKQVYLRRVELKKKKQRAIKYAWKKMRNMPKTWLNTSILLERKKELQMSLRCCTEILNIRLC